ncbi:ABC transporter ATP-binding protein [Leifsonia sp. F6_8S_P_1B]|uniref:ABC transporter ATP-binding protein n=1 Tax=Leifsonia williamsii TaxID=3035919 RepID=A0ABT8KAV6_9MICO|nr:ABC transporter ATP-binding protein [Leifsonia williamsii]MDN4614586.1 ABC transporter ATP-binding protein [Leifsonia williamsii]
MTAPLLTIEGLTVTMPTPSGDTELVHDTDIAIGDGEIVGLAGESGSGKTMTASAIMGILPAGARATGRIMFEGRNLLDLRRSELDTVRGNRIAIVFQDPTAALHPLLTIGTQITEHLIHHTGVSKKVAKARAVELLDLVRITDPHTAVKAFPHQFSGGMRQRAAIAIALACEPRLLIADEPTTALDVTVQAGILRLFDRLSRETGVSMLFITHDLGVMSAIADRTYVFKDGTVVESGVTTQILNAPEHEYTKALIASRAQSLAQGRTRAEETL